MDAFFIFVLSINIKRKIMLRFLTSGESHGKGLTTIIEGIPSNLEIEENYINKHLARRQMGYGRGGRMKIETDTAEIISGVRFQKTMGSPITLFIKNSDWENWTDEMASGKPKEKHEKITIPRPGHADLVGVSKYDLDDIRNSIERSSARETAARVAVGSVARRFLEEFGIKVGSFVENIGGVYSKEKISDKLFNEVNPNFDAWSLSEESDKSSVRVMDANHEERIVKKIKSAKKNGDTLGGTFFVVASGLPVGLGSFIQYDTKLSSAIAHDMMSINAVKAVEIGTGFETTNNSGSVSHDEIVINDGIISRKSNRTGGIEGGMTTGLPIIVRVGMKPIATLMSPIGAIDLSTMENVTSRRERSDFTAVPACAVIGESMLAITIAKAMLNKFGGDSMSEILDNYKNYTSKLHKKLKKNFKK